MRYLIVMLAILMIAACQQGDGAVKASADGDAGKTADTELVATVDSDGQTVTEDGSPSGESLNGIKEVLPSDIAPTFTRETVIKLNAIVQRSLDTIDEYDALRIDVRDEPERFSPEELKETLAGMDVEAKAALKDMEAEVTRLESSDEIYNAVVLAGMVRFVKDVEEEIETAVAEGIKF